MSKKEFLELLIKSFRLKPLYISSYRTDGCGGQYEVKVGWRGEGVDENKETVISFYEPDGFNMAVYEILRQGQGLPIKYVEPKPPTNH